MDSHSEFDKLGLSLSGDFGHAHVSVSEIRTLSKFEFKVQKTCIHIRVRLGHDFLSGDGDEDNTFSRHSYFLLIFY